jgi:tetratricopeptide (TPR) repeat protein
MVNPVGSSSAVAGNSPDPNQQAAADFNQATALLNKGDYKGAYELFSDILAGKNNDFIKANPAIYYYTGLAADYSNQTTEALKNFNAYIKLPNAEPNLVKSAKVQIDFMAASAAMSSKDPDYAGALASYQDAIKLDPGLSKDLQSTISQLEGQIDLDNAKQAQQQNDLAGMFKWYSQAALDDPELKKQLAPTITQLKNQLNFQNNIYPKINAQIQEAYNLNQPAPGQTPDTYRAIQVLQGILTEYPDLGQYCDPSMIYAPLAQFQAQIAASPPVIDGNQFQGHPEEAVEILQSAIKEHPGILQQDPSIYYRMAQYAWAAGHIDQARGFMQQFAPYQTQYQQAFQDPTGPAEFKEQLSGSGSAVIANFQTYAANWISNHLHVGSAEFWQNNVLGAFGGVMPHVDGISDYHSFGKHPVI